MNQNDLILENIEEDIQAKAFCKKFTEKNEYPKYLFGRNVYANNILKLITIDGFIDDYTDDKEYLNKKVIKLKDVPSDALVLVLSGGSTKTALRKVQEHKLKCLDYFSFYKYSNLDLKEVVFNEGFPKEFVNNISKFEWIYNLLSDDLSKKQFYNLINFRYSYNINFLKEFKYLEDKQYFEDFLNLQPNGEVFVDVGGYDGYTSEEFIKICPNYTAVHIFEPDKKNITDAKKRLEKHNNIYFHEIGLSDKKDVLKFDIGGSASKISECGEVTIHVARLDDIVKEPVTFIKMDIEGSETDAIEGAKDTILKNHPKLALSVYHKASDFWRIPEQVLSIRSDYKIYLRHYTESIYETIMFFIPVKKES